MGGFGHKSQSEQHGPAFPAESRAAGLEAQRRGTKIFGEVNPTLEGLLTNPVTPGERSAIFESNLAPVASAFDAARENAAERAARTRNPAGLLETDEQLAREKGQGLSTAANRAELSALGIEDRRRRDALRGLASLYGISEEAMARLLGQQQGSGHGSGFDVSVG